MKTAAFTALALATAAHAQPCQRGWETVPSTSLNAGVEALRVVKQPGGGAQR